MRAGAFGSFHSPPRKQGLGHSARRLNPDPQNEETLACAAGYRKEEPLLARRAIEALPGSVEQARLAHLGLGRTR